LNYKRIAIGRLLSCDLIQSFSSFQQSIDRIIFFTTTLSAFGIEHIQCVAIFETKDFPGLIIYVSLGCLKLIKQL
jgi:hypothetical protein